jgi:hypothetical protein
MKYIKKFEIKNNELQEYKFKIYINKPSTNYFKSSIVFQVIFVDTVYSYTSKAEYAISIDVIDIQGKDMIQFNRENDKEYFTFPLNGWDQTYNIDDFDRINFMTAQEFYDKYKSSYLRILEELLDYSEKKLTEYAKEKVDRIINKLTIPDVEYIIISRKYNI